MTPVVFIIVNKTSPMKLALMVCVMSVLLSFIYYTQTISLFTRRVVIISFSSGIIILFCYCASLCSYETSTKPQTPIHIAMVVVLIMGLLIFKLPINTNTRTTPTFLKACLVETSRLLVFLIGVVILVIITINKAIFNPQKKIIKSY